MDNFEEQFISRSFKAIIARGMASCEEQQLDIMVPLDSIANKRLPIKVFRPLAEVTLTQ
ncbi:hypothetical protein [Vibrio ouci]|uniref:hypothetical protein n=1 Tax=Vibrio ouci TaxID=2499078 RepID=UPI00142D39CB|nr:hypothetical protein [Vibrio ouci]